MENALKKKRGFAAMDPEKVREIASKGGKKAHETGRAHKWDKAQAREAGIKGGNARHASRGRQTKAPEQQESLPSACVDGTASATEPGQAAQ